MLSVAVCDDEVLDCCNIAGRIRAICEKRKVPCTIRQFHNGRELLQAVESFDIIFLDIMMSGMDGMETAQLLRDMAYDKLLIFLSSSREYVFEAYDVEAFQYLVKPVSDQKLDSVLRRAIGKSEHSSDEFILVTKERQNKKLLLKNIRYVEIRGRVICIHGVNGIFEYYGKIGSLEEELREKGFFRCHKSYLIHLKYVDTYNRQEVFLESGERIPLAKRRYDAFCEEILEYMKRNGEIL